MSKLIAPDVPAEISSVFTELGVFDDAQIRNILMAGALLRYDDTMMPSDNGYLAKVGRNLISSGIRVSRNLDVRVANLSLETDLFELDDEEKFDWVVLCDWAVDEKLLNVHATCEATLQSEKTFRRDSWTDAFNQARAKGFTIVGHDRNDTERLKQLALRNNRGISLFGDQYRFSGQGISYRAQKDLYQAEMNPGH